jgi:Ni/Co efflux regulator RcnB
MKRLILCIVLAAFTLGVALPSADAAAVRRPGVWKAAAKKVKKKHHKKKKKHRKRKQ